MALLPGSPAIDAGDSNAANLPSTDARGHGRVSGAAVDIGAYEAQGFFLDIFGGNFQTTHPTDAFVLPLVVKVIPSDGIDAVAGGQITFTPLGSGATASFNPGNPVKIAPNGTASVIATANLLDGTYNVSVTTTDAVNTASFTLTNASPLENGLVAAINAANAAGGATTISLPSNATYDFTFANNTTDGTNAMPVITANITIAGAGDTIDHSLAAGVAPFRLFDVAGGGSLTLENLTLTGGLAQGSGIAAEGGAIYSAGTLALQGVTVANNHATGAYGVAPANAASAEGGGLYLAGGTVTLNNDTFSGNNANGGKGSASANKSHNAFGIGGNGATAMGGGLYVASGNLTLVNDTLSGNNANGGVGAYGRQFVAGDVGGDGGAAFGGGMYVAGGIVALGNDTLSGNNAVGGGGGRDGAFSANLPGGDNGGVGGAASGGGLYVASSGKVTLSNDNLSSNNAMGGAGGRGGLADAATAPGGMGGNGANGMGGGLYLASFAVLSNDTFSGNNANGGAGGHGSASHGNGGKGANGMGGGLYLASDAVLSNDTFSGNNANGGAGGNGAIGYPHGGNGGDGADGMGGALYLGAGGITLVNNTVSGNNANGGAGGNSGMGIHPANCGNGGNALGGGLYLVSDSTTSLINSLLALDTVTAGTFGFGLNPVQAHASNPEVYGTVASSQHDLIGNSAGFNATTSDGDILDPSFVGLAALANNGGPTPTMALLPGSPAIDAGSSSLLGTIGFQINPDTALAVFADPGFETPFVGAGNFEYRPTGSPWTFAGNAGLASNGSAFNNPAAPQGSQVAFLQESGSSISQVVDVPAGTYVLNFMAAQRPGNQQAFEVKLDGAGVAKFAPSGSQFALYETAPIAFSGGQHTIQFVGLNPRGGDNTAFLDQILIGPPTDQRGFARFSGSSVDIGAYETQGFALSVTGGNNQSTAVNTAFTNPLVVTVTAKDGVDPVAGGRITFTTPGSGAGATLSPANPVTIASDGTATVNATANGSSGSYQVTATTAGVATPAVFALTNLPVPTVTVTPYNLNYDGGAHTATGTATGIGGVDLSADLTLTGTTHTNADTYTDTWIFHDPTGVYADASGTVIDGIAPDPTSISVSASSAASVYGQSMTFSATVTTATIAVPASSDGTISFYDGTTLFGTPQALSGLATATLTNVVLAAGQHRITAVYSGDSNFAASQSGVQPTSTEVVIGRIAGLPSSAVDGQGDFFLADPADSQVVEFKTDGSQTTVGSGLLYPTGVAVDGRGDVFIDDYGLQLELVVLAGLPVTVSQATTTVSVSPVSMTIPYGTALDNSQLSGTATAMVAGNNVNVPGTFTYTSAAGTVLGVGSGQSEAVTFTPTDSIDFTSAATTVIVNVVPDPTSISVSASSAATVYGQSVTFTATIATASGLAPTASDGFVEFYDEATFLGFPTLSGSPATATVSINWLPAGQHTIFARYFGDSKFTGSQSGVQPANMQTVVPVSGLNDPMAVEVDSQNDIFIYEAFNQYVELRNDGVQFSGFVLFPPPPTTEVADGHGNTFRVNTSANQVLEVKADGTTTPVGSGLNQPSGLALDSQGDLFIADSGNNRVVEVKVGVPLTVRPAATALSIASSVNPTAFGQSVTFTATVSSMSGSTLLPPAGESVTFYDGAATLGTGSLNSAGQASVTTSTLVTGTHTIAPVYAGDSNFTGSTSNAVNQTVNKDNTMTTLVGVPNPVTSGQTIIFTATVTANAPGAGTPTGTVTFTSNKTTLATVPLDGTGHATFTSSTVPTGAITVHATYNGDGHFLTSTGTTVQTVGSKAPSTTTLTSSRNPAVFGTPVTFTATVTGAGSTPTGTVSFIDSKITLATISLNASGMATFTTSSLSVGTHSIHAMYSGSSQYNTSSSNVVAQTITASTSTTLVASQVLTAQQPAASSPSYSSWVIASRGGHGSDVFIGGWTKYDITRSGMTYDQKLASLDAIMAEWGSGDSYATGLTALAGSVNTNTVRDNYQNRVAVADQLVWARKANDWFFAGSNDLVTGKSKNDVITWVN
jgi:hypothetical protein